MQEHWDRHKLPLLLSSLGGQDDGQVSRLTKQHAKNLREYLCGLLSDHVRVVQDPTRSEFIGVVPKDVEVPENAFEKLIKQSQNQSVDAPRRFRPAFWAAFRKPLDESKSRYLSIHDPILFQDSSEGEEPHGFIKIPRIFIVGPSADTTDVQKSAQDWLDENKLDSAPFLSTESRQSTRPLDLLDRLLNALDPSELERITMPLDVVLKLRRQSP